MIPVANNFPDTVAAGDVQTAAMNRTIARNPNKRSERQAPVHRFAVHRSNAL